MDKTLIYILERLFLPLVLCAFTFFLTWYLTRKKTKFEKHEVQTQIKNEEINELISFKNDLKEIISMKKDIQAIINIKQDIEDIAEIKRMSNTITQTLTNVEQANLALLRDRIVQGYNYYMDLGHCSIDDRDRLDHLYKIYKKSNGNGTIPNLMERIIGLPTEPKNS